MFHALCGIAAACTVSGQPAQAVERTADAQPPRIVEVQQREPVRPRQRAAIRNPSDYADQDNRCDQYNCMGPRTDFRLPDEIPYPDYEQQYRNPPGPRR